jgi:hypothetical protein
MRVVRVRERGPPTWGSACPRKPPNNATHVFAGRFVGGMLPRWYYSLALIARMLALAKAKVSHIRQVPPVRPIGVGSSMTCLMGGGVVSGRVLRYC